MAKQLLSEMRDSKEEEEEVEVEDTVSEDSEDEDDVKEVSPPVDPKPDRKGKRKMFEESAPQPSRMTRSRKAFSPVVESTQVEKEKESVPVETAPPQTEREEQAVPPQVEVKPAVAETIPGSSTAPSFSAPSREVESLLSFFKDEFKKMSRKLVHFELRDIERQKHIDERISKTDSILSEDLKAMTEKFNFCLKDLHEDLIDISESVAERSIKKQVPVIISDLDLVNSSYVAAAQLEYEEYVDKEVEKLRAENAKLWKFVKAHIGNVKVAEDGQFVFEKGQSSSPKPGPEKPDNNNSTDDKKL